MRTSNHLAALGLRRHGKRVAAASMRASLSSSSEGLRPLVNMVSGTRYPRVYSLVLIQFLAIQFAKMSGFSPIITTASTRHADYLRSLGATHIIDRGIPLGSLPAEVAKITTEPVLVVYDAISDTATQNAACDVLAPGGKFVVVQPPIVDAAKLVHGKEVVHVMGNVHVPGQTPVGVSLYGRLTALLEAGDIKVFVHEFWGYDLR